MTIAYSFAQAVGMALGPNESESTTDELTRRASFELTADRGPTTGTTCRLNR